MKRRAKWLIGGGLLCAIAVLVAVTSQGIDRRELFPSNAPVTESENKLQQWATPTLQIVRERQIFRTDDESQVRSGAG